MSAVRALLAGLVDYAGLFPPAALSLPDAVAEYAACRRGDESWMLGRFVVNASGLGELAMAASPHLPEEGAGPAWPVSALLGADLGADLAEIRQFDATQRGRALIETVEGKAATAGEIDRLVEEVAGRLLLYLEVPLDPDPLPLLTVLAARGARAKVRTGGLEPKAVPSIALLARFLAACAALHLPFKATAGLHHPLRGVHRFTPAEDSPRGWMHGFLNVFVAACLLREGRVDASGAERVLAEERPEAFSFEGDSLRLGEHVLASAEIRSARGAFATSFGSCSFAEPVADLRRVGLLSPAIVAAPS